MSKVNGINKNGLLMMIEKMNSDPTMGKSFPLKIEAVWDQGVVRAVGENGCAMTCHGPPDIMVDHGYTQEPSVLEYCPLMAAACFSLTFMQIAAKKDCQFDSFKVKAKTSCDLSCFYQKERAAKRTPWTEVEFDVSVEGGPSEQEIKDLADQAHKECPSMELIQEFFAVYTKVKGFTTKVDEDKKVDPYNIEAYKLMAEQDFDVLHDQEATLTWFCNDEKQDALAELSFPEDSDGRTKKSIFISMDKPIGPGTEKYANPVQLCFFGVLSFQMHTFALRLLSRGHHIQSFTGHVETVMNKRKVMGTNDVKKEDTVFNARCDIEFDCKSSATEQELQQVGAETNKMSPSYLALLGLIPIRMKTHKVA